MNIAYTVRFRYRTKINKRWSTWYTWHGKETYETIEAAKEQVWQAHKYHQKDTDFLSKVSKIEYEIVKTVTSTEFHTIIDF